MTDFAPDQFEFAYPPGVEHNFWTVARNRLIQRELSRAVKIGALRPNSRMLEVGSGPGIVLKYLLMQGWDVWGSELGKPKQVEGTEGRLLLGKQAEDLPVDFRESIEALLLFDVIEHIENDSGFLRSLLDAFRHASYVIVTVPARPEVWSNFDSYYGHCRRYRPESLKKTFVSSGLEPMRVRYFFHSLYLTAKIINAVGLERSVHVSATAYPRLHRRIAEVFCLENALLGPWEIIPGLSLIAVGCRKNRDNTEGAT